MKIRQQVPIIFLFYEKSKFKVKEVQPKIKNPLFITD